MIELRQEEGRLSFWTIYSDGECVARMRKRAFSRPTFQSALSVSADLADLLFLLARHYALTLVSRKSYHSHQLTKKLEDAGFSSSSIGRVLAFLKEKEYLNDDSYCQRKIESLQRMGRSPKEISFRMKQQGLGETSLSLDEEDSLMLCLRKKYPKWKDLIKESPSRIKLIRALLRRGFSLDSVYKALK